MFVPLARAMPKSRLECYLKGARRYAQAASSSKLSGNSSGSAAKGSWKPKQPLATAQTLTLFSETPQGLLIALRSTLQGMTSMVSRLGPAPTASSSSTSASSSHAHVLLFALSKNLPPKQLGEAVALLQGNEADNGDKKSSAPQGISNIARVGLLSSALPTSLIPSNALEPDAPPILSPTLYSVSLSLLPGTNAVPFRSTIPGKSEVAVGRWMDRKASWKEGTERQSDLLDSKDAGDAASAGRDWKEIWGRENLQGDVPEALSQLDPGVAASFLVFSDTSSQGLVEGLATRFPASSVLGLVAPPTPFETGRDQTILLSIPGQTDNIFTDGAVGVALVANVDAQTASREGQDSIAIPAVSTWFEGLLPFGVRRQISAAQGNIISSLDKANAAQQFLRDIQSRTQSAAQTHVDTDGMSESETRSIASSVKKEEEFYIAIFRSADGKMEEPLLVARILSGHPSRGTLSVETDVDLGPGPGNEQGTMQTYAQFYQTDPGYQPRQSGQSLRPSAIEIPGPDPSAWVTPRFLFLSLPSSSDTVDSQSATQAVNSSSKKHQVMALPNLFIAASERGWISGRGCSAAASTRDSNPSNVLRSDGSTVVNCNVPLARAMLSLRGD